MSTVSRVAANGRLKRGRFYRLLVDVGVIPAGVYRFEGIVGDGYTFSVDARRLVFFRISERDQWLLGEVSYRQGLAIAFSKGRASQFSLLYQGQECAYQLLNLLS